MLSRILRGQPAENASPAVFPPVTVPVHRPVVESAAPDAGVASALRETIRGLESRLQTETRTAFEAGRQQGEQTARAEIEPVLARLVASINELAALRPDLRNRAERDTVQLALLIARRVLHRELAVDENALVAIARVACERLARSESCRVTVHPRFAPAIAAALSGSHARLVQIEPDPGCEPGTLIFHSVDGIIDASIDVQLDEIGRGLADRLGHPLSSRFAQHPVSQG